MDNPYEVSNQENLGDKLPQVMVRAVTLVVGMIVGGAVLGGILGLVIGSVAPGYYQSMFPGTAANLIQLGFGLGVTQGAGVGLFASLALIAITYYFRYRPQHQRT